MAPRILVLTLLLAACRESTTTRADAGSDGTTRDAPAGDAPRPDASASAIMEACTTSCVALEACMSFPTCVAECVEDVTQANCNAQELDMIKACASVACNMMIGCLTAIPCLMP
jgi:hypothetical protein